MRSWAHLPAVVVFGLLLWAAARKEDLMASQQYSNLVGPVDQVWLIGTPLSGVQGGYRVIGRGHLRYTAPTSGLLYIEVDATNGWTGQVDPFPAGVDADVSFPIYGFVEWPVQSTEQVRLTIGVGAGATVHQADFEVGVEPKPTLVA